MRDLTVGVFDHLEITYPMDVDKRLAYTQRILRGSALKRYREVLVAYRQSEKELTGYEWNLGNLAGLYVEAFRNWSKTNTTGYDGYPFFAWDKCVNFERELWFELGECMWMKDQSVY